MTRGVAASAALMSVLSKTDARDFMSLPYEGIDFSKDLEVIDLKKLRIAFLPDMKVGLPVNTEVAAAATAAAKALEGAGAPIGGRFGKPRDRLLWPLQRHRRQRDCDVASQPGGRAFELEERVDGSRMTRGGEHAEDSDRRPEHRRARRRPRCLRQPRDAFFALVTEQALRSLERGLHLGRHLRQRHQRRRCRAIANPAGRENRVVLERSVEADDRDDRVHRVPGALLAERADDSAAEEVEAPPGFRDERALNHGVVCVRGKGPDEGGTNELGLFGVQRREQCVVKRRFRVDLEPAIGDLADTIIPVCEQPAHDRTRARVVERGQQHQRAVPDKLIGVQTSRARERRNSLGGGGAADHPRGVHPRGKVEGRERLDVFGESGRRVLRRSADGGQKKEEDRSDQS